MVGLIPGRTYRVRLAFLDHDRRVHPAGETWIFVKESFLPYEDGLTLEILRNGHRETIRMQWRVEEQGPVLDHFDQYVAMVE